LKILKPSLKGRVGSVTERAAPYDGKQLAVGISKCKIQELRLPDNARYQFTKSQSIYGGSFVPTIFDFVTLGSSSVLIASLILRSHVSLQ